MSRVLLTWIGGVATVGACSAGGSHAEFVAGRADAETGDGAEAVAEAPLTNKDAGAKPKDGGAKPTDASAKPPALNNAANCGAAGHDCGGAACVSGVCEPEKLATVKRPHALAVAGASLVFVDSSPGNQAPLYKMSKAPSAAVPTVVPGPSVRNFDLLELKVGGGFVYILPRKSGAGPLLRRPLSGTDAGVDERVGGELDTVDSFDVDATHVTFKLSEYPRATFLQAHAGAAPVEFPTLASDPMRRSFVEVSLTGSSIFGLYEGDVYEVKKGGGGATLRAPILASNGYESAFAATPNAFYGVRFQRSNPVTCGTTTFDVWRQAMLGTGGGLIHSGAGWVPSLRADAQGALYPLQPCGGGPTKLMAYRETDGASYVVAEFDGATDVFAADDAYVYFTRVDDNALYRVAR